MGIEGSAWIGRAFSFADQQLIARCEDCFGLNRSPEQAAEKVDDAQAIRCNPTNAETVSKLGEYHALPLV